MHRKPNRTEPDDDSDEDFDDPDDDSDDSDDDYSHNAIRFVVVVPVGHFFLFFCIL